MSDHPIIFSGPMVQALLAGRKTQTRRLASSPLAKAQPGDRLWVREAWAPHPGGVMKHGAVYRADPGAVPDAGRWRPSIHMPRVASRLTLTVTDVRVQRLQAMDNNDALHEGTPDLRTIENGWDLRECFARLWNSLHGPAAWTSNPEVVCLSFRCVARNIDEVSRDQAE